MSTLKSQTDAQIEKSRQAKPEFMKGVEDLIAQAKEFKTGSDAIQVAAKAPSFELPDSTGTPVRLDDLLARGKVVVTFYRGDWCPYCNLQLRALQARIAEIHDLGAELVAISPQFPDGSMSVTERVGLEFTVLSDQNAEVAGEYGVAWQVPEMLLDHMRKDRNLDLADINKGNGTILPIPATFVLNADGIVTWRYVDVDYRGRAEPDDIIAALKAS
ncbi:Peroxiredoxin [Neorhodopirellula lusitana]|uniref:thioredoxin-dependent peroxiredoxin n=1 Tax=Neorhodopirellula lusitana TaxID=445327 RepID=A0ABY1QGZ0_9BACT|nr:peroxiredoxin-like family protein [Neorhodopirellula lusitana]SMP71314.1 Peroxiredoxin [Neorhodopirellula lusitana]